MGAPALKWAQPDVAQQLTTVSLAVSVFYGAA